MISVLTGENSFEIERELARRVKASSCELEMVDGASVTKETLADIFMGATLFSSERLVVVRGLSDNKDMWIALEDWLAKLSDTTELILIESKPDKRTKTYKALQKQAKVEEFKPLGERDQSKAEMWLKSEAKHLHVTLDADAAKELVARLGVEQWTLFHELEKLSAYEHITKQIVETHTQRSPHDSVFELLATALASKTQQLHEMLDIARLLQDPYMTLGLLNSQIFQLSALILSDEPSDTVAKDIGGHPFALRKLSGYRRTVSKKQLERIVTLAAETDMESKTSTTEPWTLVEALLVKISLGMNLK